MRTFVALNLDRAVKERLHEAVAPLHSRGLPVRWTPAENLHMTLKFLGDIEGAEVRRLHDTLRAVAGRHEPLELSFEGFGAFPSLRRASVLWIGVTPERALMEMQADLELQLSRLGYARETRPFRPHITVGRARSDARALDVQRFAGAVEVADVAGVTTVDLMRSHLGGEGARYEPLLKAALGERVE